MGGVTLNVSSLYPRCAPEAQNITEQKRQQSTIPSDLQHLAPQCQASTQQKPFVQFLASLAEDVCLHPDAAQVAPEVQKRGAAIQSLLDCYNKTSRSKSFLV